jgi:endonuclease/exonuclease/phosphatase family metal-dependent hydrolase
MLPSRAAFLCAERSSYAVGHENQRLENQRLDLVRVGDDLRRVGHDLAALQSADRRCQRHRSGAPGLGRQLQTSSSTSLTAVGR